MSRGGDGDPERPAPPRRRQLVRDVVVFQLKLFADGLRDLILSPVSIVLGLLDAITGGRRFYDLLSLGARTDVWINLFGKHDRAGGIDDAVERIETLIAEQYEKGDVTASAKRAVDNTLAKLTRERDGDQS